MSIAVSGRMRAIACYGWARSVRLDVMEAAVPQPGPGDVQVQVYASSVNPKDWKLNLTAGRVLGATGRTIKPFFGDDLAGVVTAVGSKVTDFRVGDRVYGMDMRPRTAALAEYAVINAQRIAHIPEGLSFEEAASLPLAAQTALQALRNHAGLQAGQSVLVIGAGGGVGTLAVQIARAMGADVVGVCSGRNADRVLQLGASDVIDYTQTDIHKQSRRYDMVFDVTSHDRPAWCRPLLNPEGKFVATGGYGGVTAAVMGEQLLRRMGVKSAIQASTVVVESWRADLEQLNVWIEDGQLRAIIDRRYALPETDAAYRYSYSGKAQGKIVITIAGEQARI